MVSGDADGGVVLARVVAVVATLQNAREQVGSGYLINGRLVLTAEHCTRDKTTGQAATGLRVIRASDGQSAVCLDVLASPSLDVAVVRLSDAAWPADLPAPAFARVDRSRAGILADCVAIGFPLFQYDPGPRDRKTAELHGTIYQTDEAEVGRLLLREPLLTNVHPTAAPADVSAGQMPPGSPVPSPWFGVSGAVVFHAGRALGVIVEHHPQQGAAAMQLVTLEQIARATDPDGRAIAQALALPGPEQLPLAAAQLGVPLAELADLLGAPDLPRLAELTPYQLGADSSDYGNRTTHGERDPYVPRTHHDVDRHLWALLEPGALVLLVGPSKAGKTRSAFQAAQECWPGAHVLVPIPGRLSELATHHRLHATSDTIIVWLDDLQQYLGATGPPDQPTRPHPGPGDVAAGAT